MSQFYIDCILFDPYLVDRHIVRQWPAEELTGTHIVSGEVAWAYDDIAFELAPGEGGPVMTALVADGVEEPCHVDQQQPLPVGDDHLHLAWGELGNLGHGHKPSHGLPLLAQRTAPGNALRGAKCAGSAWLPGDSRLWVYGTSIAVGTPMPEPPHRDQPKGLAKGLWRLR